MVIMYEMCEDMGVSPKVRKVYMYFTCLDFMCVFNKTQCFPNVILSNQSILYILRYTFSTHQIYVAIEQTYIDKFVSIWLCFAGNISFPSRVNVCFVLGGILGVRYQDNSYMAAVEQAMLSSLLSSIAFRQN